MFRGSVAARRGRGVRKSTLKVKSVEIAVQRSGKDCRWLSSLRGDLRIVDAGAGGAATSRCGSRRPGRRSGAWRCAASCPPGRYTLFSRAVLANGVAEARFTRADHTRVTFRVR